MESEPQIDATEEDSTEEIDFDLDLDDEGDSADGAVMEETEELDLADLEEMIEVDEDAGGEAAERTFPTTLNSTWTQ